MRTFLAALVLIISACAQTPPPSVPASPGASHAPATPLASEHPPAPAPSASPPPAPTDAPPTAGTAAKPTDAAPLATLARTACYGFCPVYSLKVLANGAVEYEGESFVKVKGRASGQLDEAALARLKQAFAEAKFSSLENSYETVSRTDAPSAIVSFADRARVKTVRHYHGDMAAPPALSKLEDEIDTIVHVEQWIGTQEERSKSAGKWGR